MVFIDGPNLYRTLMQEMGDARVDYVKFSNKLVGPDRRLVRTYYYTALVPRTGNVLIHDNQQRLLQALRRTPYVHVRLGRLERRGGTYVEKGVDVQLAVDMLRHAYRGNYDTAILVSGDGDFAAVIEAVTEMGKSVEVASTKTGRSDRLFDVADRIICLDEAFMADCWFHPARGAGNNPEIG